MGAIVTFCEVDEPSQPGVAHLFRSDQLVDPRVEAGGSRSRQLSLVLQPPSLGTRLV